MFKKLPLRIKITVVTIILLISCCLGLTLIINYAGKQMSVQMATVTTPAMTIDDSLSAVFPSETIEAAISSVERQQLLNNYYLTSFVYMLLIILVGGFVAYYLAGEALTSVTQLNKKIQESSIANLSDDLEIPMTNDEVAQLTASFNTLKAQLNTAFVFQKTFSANVAHELRTPLTVLNTKLAIFKRKNPTLEKEIALFVNDLEKQVSRLIEMVEKLLELTNEEEILEKSHVDLNDLFESIQLDLSDQLQQKKMTIQFDLTKKIAIYGDLDLLYQVFYNLIENAIKYSHTKSEIYLSATETVKETRIVIADQGIGIPQRHREAIFNPLFRVDESRNQEISGSGLGLAIVKKIVTKHGGQIYVEEQNNSGSQFIVILPKEKKA